MRERTPPDAVVVSPPGPVPVLALTQRSEYLGRWRKDAGRPGYGYQARVWIVDVRGAPAAVFEGRVRVQRAVYAKTDQPARFAWAAEALRSLGRPLAIYFPSTTAPFRRFLEREQIGHETWTDGKSSIWQVDPAAGS